MLCRIALLLEHKNYSNAVSNFSHLSDIFTHRDLQASTVFK